MRKIFAVGILVLTGTGGCAMQMAKEQAGDRCTEEGKQPFVLDARHNGIPLLIEAASVEMMCVGPEDIEHIASAFGVDVIGGPRLHGVGIVAVAPGSVADKAGIKFNDVIYEYAGHTISTPSDLQAAIEDSPRSGLIPIKLRRKGHEVTCMANF